MNSQLPIKRLIGSTRPAVGLLVTTLFLAFGLVLSGCDSTVNQEGDAPIQASDSIDASTTINNPPPEDFDAVGTISGRVIDRVTNEPLEGVTVSIFDTLTVTTGASGSFSLSGVPVNTTEDGGDDNVVTTYNVHISIPDDMPYRSNYSAEVAVPFIENFSGGAGGPNNLGANVTFPLSKTNGSVSGTVLTPGQVPLADATVRLRQDLIVRFNSEGPDDDADPSHGGQ